MRRIREKYEIAKLVSRPSLVSIVLTGQIPLQMLQEKRLTFSAIHGHTSLAEVQEANLVSRSDDLLTS